MKAVQVDERDGGWESTDPTFKAILFDAAGSWAVDTWNLSECGVLDAIRWAQENVVDGGAWALGLVSDRPGPEGREVGFVYLEGFDLNADSEHLTAWESKQLDEMLRRRSHRVVLNQVARER